MLKKQINTIDLYCPKCGKVLLKRQNTYQCMNLHNYDIAKQGYVNLLLGHKSNHGDDAIMTTSRTQFLSKGYYNLLKNQLIHLLNQYDCINLVDVGCGEGYYTNYFANRENTNAIIGVDLSKSAIKQACKAKSKASYILASIADLPLKDACCDCVISIFTPIYSKEFSRILKQGGIFIKVEPGPYHLYDLKKILYKEVYLNKPKEMQYSQFYLQEKLLIEDYIYIDNNEDIMALFKMTPYYYRSPKETSEILKQMNLLSTQIQFQISIYRKK